MSNSLINRVYELDITCTYQRHVLQRLADRTNDKTGVCWPSVGSLARDVCCSERKVQSVLKELIHRGLVSVKQNAGRNGCNLYCLTLPPAPGAPEPKVNQKKTSPRHTSKLHEDLLINAIKEGKPYLLRSVSAHKASTLVSEGRVTEKECKEVGLL